MLKVYAYAKCGTCRKAKKFLEAEGIKHQEVPIRETPPTKTELNTMLRAYDGNVRKLFNTSGGDYKAMNLKAKLPDMGDAEAIGLLAEHGNLVKRPFAIGDGVALVGFNEDNWREALG